MRLVYIYNFNLTYNSKILLFSYYMSIYYRKDLCCLCTNSKVNTTWIFNSL